MERYRNLRRPTHRILEEEKPANSVAEAREFDGTFNVTPQVYGTYSTNDVSVKQEGGTESHEVKTRYSSRGQYDTSDAAGSHRQLGTTGVTGMSKQERLDQYDSRGVAVGGVPDEPSTGIARGQYHMDHVQYGTDNRLSTVTGASEFRDGSGNHSGDYSIDGVPLDNSEVGVAYGVVPPLPQSEIGGEYDGVPYGDCPQYQEDVRRRGFPPFGNQREEDKWAQRQGILCTEQCISPSQIPLVLVVSL